MQWFPFHVNDLSTPVCSAATSEALGAWVRMLANAYRLENSGCYKESSEHSSRQWMSIAGVTSEEVAVVVSAGLASWNGSDLTVFGYDEEQQSKAKKRSKKALLANDARWRNPPRIATGNPPRNPEEMRGEERKEDEKRSSSSQLSMDPVSTEQALMEFKCDGSPSSWALVTSQVEQWSSLYKSLDIMDECRKAMAWVDASPEKRRTARGMKRFLVNWFNRAVNYRGSQVAGTIQHRQQDIRVGHTRAEDYKHTKIGEVDL